MVSLYKDLGFRLIKIKLLVWLCCQLNQKISRKKVYLVFLIIPWDNEIANINDYLKMMINNL